MAQTPPKLLKDMTDAQIRALYGADRFTVTVLASRFRYLIDHVCAQLQTNNPVGFIGACGKHDRWNARAGHCGSA